LMRLESVFFAWATLAFSCAMRAIVAILATKSITGPGAPV
jgi:hypothetical protein